MGLTSIQKSAEDRAKLDNILVAHREYRRGLDDGIRQGLFIGAAVGVLAGTILLVFVLGWISEWQVGAIG